MARYPPGMLREDKGAWTVTCEVCGVGQDLVAPGIDGARRVAVKAGWLDQARKGKPLAKWAWKCPRCRPGDASGKYGRST